MFILSAAKAITMKKTRIREFHHARDDKIISRKVRTKNAA